MNEVNKRPCVVLHSHVLEIKLGQPWNYICFITSLSRQTSLISSSYIILCLDIELSSSILRWPVQLINEHNLFLRWAGAERNGSLVRCGSFISTQRLSPKFPPLFWFKTMVLMFDSDYGDGSKYDLIRYSCHVLGRIWLVWKGVRTTPTSHQGYPTCWIVLAWYHNAYSVPQGQTSLQPVGWDT